MPGRLVVQQTDGGRHIIESPHVKAPSARAGVAFPGESRWSSHLDKNGFPIQIVTCVAVIRAILQTHELESLRHRLDRKSTRLNSSHRCISYAVFCLKKKKKKNK